MAEESEAVELLREQLQSELQRLDTRKRIFSTLPPPVSRRLPRSRLGWAIFNRSEPC